MIHFKSLIYQLERLLNVHYIEVPVDIISELGGSINVRVLCTVNNRITYQSGLMALGEGKAYITLSKARLKKLQLQVGDEVNVSLQKDTSKYGTPMPEEMKEWLSQDQELKEKFDVLSPSMQRYIMQYIDGVKSPLKRMERASLLLDNLKRSQCKVSFRFLLGKED